MVEEEVVVVGEEEVVLARILVLQGRALCAWKWSMPVSLTFGKEIFLREQ